MKKFESNKTWRHQQLVEKKEIETKLIIPINILQSKDSLSPEEFKTARKLTEEIYRSSNARCVPVGTKMIAPVGRKKKEMFKAKRVFVKFRCTVFEKKLLQVKAKRSGLSVSGFCRQVAAEKNIRERLSEDHLEIYKNLLKFHNNFKSIGNMFRKKNPKLSMAVYKIAEEIKLHLQKIEK